MFIRNVSKQKSKSYLVNPSLDIFRYMVGQLVTGNLKMPLSLHQESQHRLAKPGIIRFSGRLLGIITDIGCDFDSRNRAFSFSFKKLNEELSADHFSTTAQKASFKTVRKSKQS